LIKIEKKQKLEKRKEKPGNQKKEKIKESFGYIRQFMEEVTR